MHRNHCVQAFFVEFLLVLTSNGMDGWRTRVWIKTQPWSAVMPPTLRTSHSSIQSKLSHCHTNRKVLCGNPGQNLLANCCTTAPLHHCVAPLSSHYTQLFCAHFSSHFCNLYRLRILQDAFFFFLSLKHCCHPCGSSWANEQCRWKVSISFSRVWTILPLKRHECRSVVSKVEMILADHFSFDKSQIAAHDSLLTGMEVEQHIQNSPRCRRLALWDCFWGHDVDLDRSIRFWVASWDLQN